MMRYLGDEFKKIPGMSFIHEFTDTMFHPIFLKQGADGKVDHERLHPDGITYSAASLASFWHQKTVYASSFYLSPLAVT